MLQASRLSASLLLAGLVASAGCRPPAAALEVEKLLGQRQYAAAQARVEQALTHDPGSDALWRLRLRVHLAQGQRQAAVDAYRQRATTQGESRQLLRDLSLEVLEEGLESRRPEVRLAAIQAARETDAPELEEAVGARLQDPDPLVRTWAAVALSQRADGAEVLEAQLQASDSRAREVAVREVGRIAGAAALGPLLRATSDGEARVRAAAVTALAATRRPEALAALRRLLTDPSATVRADVAREVGRARLSELAPELHRLLRDPHLSVQLAAVTSLAELGPEAQRPLLRSLAASPELLLALRAGLQLARLGEVQPALDAIARALIDRQWTIRAAACTSASLLRDRVGVELVQKVLRDPEPRVRLAAARTLIAARGAAAEAAVKVALSVQQLSCAGASSVPDLCLEASDLLVRAGRGEGLQALRQQARTAPTPEQRLQALRNALLLAPDRALALDGLADPHEENAMAAAAWLYLRLK